ncbi:MAG: phosphate-binding protein, partial [Planctomycetaceae bacterium]|nr:phosphate-binding protein [Planctomycetaceae bacterium]
TFEYFNEEIIGKDIPEGQSLYRTDYTPAVNDTTLVDGVKGNKYALGYFGYAYYVQNKASLKALGIAKSADKSDCVAPTEETIGSGQYAPLSRPLFIYVNKESLLTKPEVAKFVEYYLNEGQAQVSEVGYIELPADRLEASKKTLAEALAGAAE